MKAAVAAAAKGAVRSVEAAPPGAGDAVCQAGAARAGGAPAEIAPAGAAPAGAAPAGAAPARATPAGGPAVYEEAAPALDAAAAARRTVLSPVALLLPLLFCFGVCLRRSFAGVGVVVHGYSSRRVG